MARPAVFLDRDGTLVRDVRHSADPAGIEVLAGVAEALVVLREAGFRLVVVTNQSGVARGAFTLAEAKEAGEALRQRLEPLGASLDGYYLCPHYAAGTVAEFAFACACRKPAPGLVLAAAEALDLDLAASWMVGDSPSDVQAGIAAGVKVALIDIGRPDIGAALPAGIPVVRNLPHAAAVILGRSEAAGTAAMSKRAPRDDRRAAGEPSPWPDGRWAAAARREAAMLRRNRPGA